jgi:hypothetical protein
MRTDFRTRCLLCKKPLKLEARGAAPFQQTNCEECRSTVSLVDGPFPLVERLVMRADAEFSEGDWTVPIILLAIAVESLIATVHRKWTFLPAKLPDEETPHDGAEWEGRFRAMKTVKDRINSVSLLMTDKTLNNYLHAKYRTASRYSKTVPSLRNTFALKAWQRSIFDRRNKIVHQAFLDYIENDARECRIVAIDAIRVLSEMDKERADRMHRESPS